MFEKFRTSPLQIKKDVSVESNVSEKAVKSPKQIQVTSPVVIKEKQLTQAEIDYKIMLVL